ncbi:hypothetical protein PVK06_002444 [Gossypium arboreum]|uniref:Transposase MuDR plant domain-containing protein n=1 Tax=Gossypium arboreum TaxID=29729 RepID=A0ABR0R4X2_GOSAR|nr:hypothetical protein PVK06_002444 [Gossypium arboreum]
MHNVNLSIDDGFEFVELPHRRPGHASFSLDSGDLRVGNEFSTKDGFLTIVKRYSLKNGVNFHMVKSRSKKFEAKWVMRDSRCTWKIMAYFKKKTRLWMIKKLTIPQMYEFVKGCFHEMLKILRSTNQAEARYLSNIPFN